MTSMSKSFRSRTVPYGILLSLGAALVASPEPLAHAQSICVRESAPLVDSLGQTIQSLDAITGKFGYRVCETEVEQRYHEIFDAPSNRPGVKPNLKTKKWGAAVVSGTPAELEAVEKLIGKTPPPHWAELTKECRTAACAVSALFDPPSTILQAQKLMILAARTPWVVSFDQTISKNESAYTEAPALFSASETDWIYDFFDRTHLPKVATERSTQTRIVKRKLKGSCEPQTSQNPQTQTAFSAGGFALGDQVVVLSSCISSKAAEFQHELGHVIASLVASTPNSSLAHEAEFLALSGWEKAPRTRSVPKSGSCPTQASDWNPGTEVVDVRSIHSGFVSSYALCTPDEDFAESFEMFTRDPGRLLHHSPEKFHWFRNKFFGGEVSLTDSMSPALRDFCANGRCLEKAVPSCLAAIHQTGLGSLYPKSPEMRYFMPGESVSNNLQAHYTHFNECAYKALEPELEALSSEERCRLGSRDEIATQLGGLMNRTFLLVLSEKMPPFKGFSSRIKREEVSQGLIDSSDAATSVAAQVLGPKLRQMILEGFAAKLAPRPSIW